MTGEVDYRALADELDKRRLAPVVWMDPGEYITNVALERLSMSLRALAPEVERMRAYLAVELSDTGSVVIPGPFIGWATMVVGTERLIGLEINSSTTEVRDLRRTSQDVWVRADGHPVGIDGQVMMLIPGIV